MLDLYLRNLPLTILCPAGLENLMRTRGELAITSFKNGLYKSREDAAKSHGVDPNTLRRRLNGKYKSYKVAHTHQQRLLPPAESAVVRQCIYLANAGFPARIRTIRVIARFSKNKQESFLPINYAKKVDEEVNTQVEVDDDEQSNSSDIEVLDEDVGMDIGNVVQSIE